LTLGDSTSESNSCTSGSCENVDEGNKWVQTGYNIVVTIKIATYVNPSDGTTVLFTNVSDIVV